ncbi:MAG TPA: BtpA/SgcQ family protein, partial [Roseiflexaceae bacterium]|nr:BtpA/SgcQ family protein [Roseiflexaceae bacterium]
MQSTRFHTLFPAPRPIIGMIALPPLPGYAGSPGVEGIVAAALEDLAALGAGGMHAALVENDFDRPHALTVGPEVVAAMARVASEVAARAPFPVGVQVLLNDWRATLAVAAVAGARFVRLDFFVDRVCIGAGVVEPDPTAVLAYRAAIGAADVAILADIQVKYSVPLEPGKPLALSARQAAAAGADAVVVTGSATGVPPTAADLKAARAGGVPVLIGSGLTPANAPALLPLADGAIVGTALRSGPGALERVDEGR